MRADGKWQCSELTGQPTYLLATATGTVSDYSDAFGIDNHVYDFAFIRLILKALQLGLPLADHRRRFEHRPDPVTRRLLFLCRSQSCRVGTTSDSWPRGYTWGRWRARHSSSGSGQLRAYSADRWSRLPRCRSWHGCRPSVRRRSRRPPGRPPLPIVNPSGTDHHPGLHTGADAGE